MTTAPTQPPPPPRPVLSYGIEPKSKHEQIYAILLIVLAFIFLIAIVTILTLPTSDPESRWTMRTIALIEGCYLAAIVATLIARLVSPPTGRLLTQALNILLVIYFPLGTALALYRFLKVDKHHDPQPS